MTLLEFVLIPSNIINNQTSAKIKICTIANLLKELALVVSVYVFCEVVESKNSAFVRKSITYFTGSKISVVKVHYLNMLKNLWTIFIL